ncbi:MAG: carbohydrate kinase [Desulfobulbaceae bacterium]|mgnify:FL=1|nr:MAG: carbohydrate kinase [Desulfobulbaceae bacterium]
MPEKQLIIFGETLFDVFTDGSEVLGGAPFNVAWHLQGFGLLPKLVTRVGADSRGQQIVRSMSSWGMDTSYVQIDTERPTGRVDITLQGQEPSFFINPDQSYGHISAPEIIEPEEVALIYHGSLAVWNSEARKDLGALRRELASPVFIDVNLRDPWWQVNIIHSLVESAEWVKMNNNELRVLFPQHSSKEKRIEDLFTHFSLETLILTEGSRGATAYMRNETSISVQPEEKVSVVDTVGAGDAFSSVFILGQVLDWDIEKRLNHAQEFATKIVSQRGAIVEHPEIYSTYLKQWT